MKRVLILGGNIYQKKLIITAKKKGFYVVTADNNPNNPGHEYSSKYYNISTVEKESILKLAKHENIDAILSAASDVALNTIGYVNDIMQLNGINYFQADIFTDKLKFRNYVKEKKLSSFYYKEINSEKEIYKIITEQQKTMIIKPAKSSGSKGVRAIRTEDIKNFDSLKKIFNSAKYFSLNNKVILEEFIEGEEYSAEGYTIDGVLQSITFTEKLTTVFPLKIPIQHITTDKINRTVKTKIINFILNLFETIELKNTVFDLDLIINKDKFHIIEITPRTGGNCIPNIIKYHKNIDLLDIALEMAIGNNKFEINERKYNYVGVRILRSKQDGKLVRMKENKEVSDKLNKYLLEKQQDYKPGSNIHIFKNGSHRIGHIILQNQKISVLKKILKETDYYFKLTLEN